VQSWVRKAEGDLRAAERLLDIAQDDYFATAFHAQQAAEKFLKAFLVRHQIPFPKTHDIQHLLNLAAQHDPGLQEVAQRAVQEAQRVRAAVLEALKAYLDRGRPPEAAP